jgi:Zn-dependent peptidase ImmA (M78 family)
MTTSEEIATVAYKGAIDVRERAGIHRLDPMNIFDCAQKLNVEVRFIVGGTFEGMYEKDRRVIILPTDRPAGRRVFTCAHELAHWRYKHGSMLDDATTVESYNERPEERLANMFAGYLLMFPPAVESVRTALGINYSNCSAQALFSLASWFGVSYASVIGHLHWALGKLSHRRYEELRKVTPRAIRSLILGGRESPHLVVFNRVAPRMPIDLEVGDLALLPSGVSYNSGCLATIETQSNSSLVEAVAPGIALLSKTNDDWAAVVRVMRRGYTGRSVFRHLESDDDE